MAVRDAREGFLFGCDPEVFIVDAEGKAVSAAGIIPGTKTEPLWIDDIAIQVDGMAAEFNIKPAGTFADFNRRIDNALEALTKRLPEGHRLAITPAVTFSEDVFADSPDEAKELGCQPDFDAWSGSLFPPPMDPDNPLMRCAGGHLHVGWGNDLDVTDDQHILNCRDLTKQFDWYLGAWSVRLDPDPIRRRLYGKAGAYRPKTYGCEYRTLSNFWITTRDRRLMVWNRMQKAIGDMRDRFYPERNSDWNEVVVESINSSTRHKELEGIFYRPIVSIDSRF